MSGLNVITYPNSFLSNVIIRFDFLTLVDSELVFHQDIQKEILKSYPVLGMDQIIQFGNLNIRIDSTAPENPATASKDVKTGLQREYYNIDKSNKIVLSNNFLLFDIVNYQSYNILRTQLREILPALFSIAAPIIVRTGIRYINMYTEDRIKIRKIHLNPSIATALDRIKPKAADDMVYIQSNHTVDYQVNDMALRFRYGVFDADFPRNTKGFALDYDCFTDEAMTNSDQIINRINEGHNAIQNLFEWSISDRMREIMING